MPELTEDVLAPDVMVRRAPTTQAQVRSSDDGTPLVGAGDGALWARAEAGSVGVDLGHGSINVLLRHGTVLFDAQGGAGLVIVLRGEVGISVNGQPSQGARAGEALTFDANGQVGGPDPVDAPELARDPFIALNLVLDALAGAPLHLADAPSTDGTPPGRDPIGPDESRKIRGIFGTSRSGRDWG